MSKHVEFMTPIDYMTGNLSGRQLLEYGAGGEAYEQPSGQITAATNYEPRLIAKRIGRNTLRARSYFQIRTRTAVNMTENVRLNLAVMGGAGAIFASLLQMKESEIYVQCIAAKPDDLTLRQFIMPTLKAALAAKESEITIAQGIVLNNPWVDGGSGVTIDVSQVILAKFMSVLGVDSSPYNAAATAALKAAFSDAQWAIIRDYGFSHQVLVPIINTWAPIDVGLMYRLILELGIVRYLKRTGLAYIDTGIAVNAAFPFELDCVWIEFDTNRGCILSNYAAGNVGIGYELSSASAVRHYFQGDKLTTAQLGLDTEHTIHSEYNAQTGVIVSVIDGTTYYPSSAVQSGTATESLLWMTDHRISALTAQVQQANQRILANGIEHIYAPITNNGVVGLLDIKSDGTAEFKSNAYSSGSFEIIETPVS